MTLSLPPWAPRLFSLLGWLLLAPVLAALIWSLLLAVYPVKGSVEQAAAPKARLLWPAGLERHWQQPQTAAVQQPVVVSRLAVQVQGVLASDDPRRSVVLLKYRGREMTLSVGDELEAGIQLVEIHADYLVFNRQGQLEQVALQLGAAAPGAATANLLDRSSDAVAARPAQASSGRSRNASPAQAASSNVPSAPINESVVGTRALEETFGPNFRESLIRDPLQLMKYVTLAPHSEGGQLQGFRLQPGSDTSLFSHFGLQPGDLLVAVDGVSVTDTPAMMGLHGRLQSASSLEVDLIRNNESLRIRLELE